MCLRPRCILIGALQVHRAPELEAVPSLRRGDHISPVWGPILFRPSGHIHVNVHPSVCVIGLFCSAPLGAAFLHYVSLATVSLSQCRSPSYMYSPSGLRAISRA